jgi:glycosyltransferase involved in cell wall biosynthesis
VLQTPDHIISGVGMKKVSIVIINYNDKERVQRAIESAINQTYENKEVIVVDDGSTDDVKALYKPYKDKIRLIERERVDIHKRTPSGARNEGLKHITGDYVAFLDSDNYYHKDFIKDMAKYDNDVIYCNWKIEGLINYDVIIEDKWKKEFDLLKNYLIYTHLDHQCLLIKKDIMEKYDERLPRSQDADMIVRLMLKTNDWRHVNKQLFIFENHEKDQYKNVASIYGKTLWILKHGLTLEILIDKIKMHPVLLFSMFSAINDFGNNTEWQEDRENSLYKKVYDEYIGILEKELSE